MATPMAAATKPIFTAGLIAGALDLVLAVTFFTVRGAPLDAVPHAIAGGLLGPKAFHEGLATALLGVALHFFIALTVAAVYFAASRRIGFLNHHPLISGTVYGLAVFAFMQHIVLPLSAEPRSRPSHAWLIADIASHIFFIGITIALIVRRLSQVG